MDHSWRDEYSGMPMKRRVSTRMVCALYSMYAEQCAVLEVLLVALEATKMRFGGV